MSQAPHLAFGSGRLYAVPQFPAALITPVEFGFLQDVSIDFSGTVKELLAQFQYPVDVARGVIKITGKAKMAKISANGYNSLFFGLTEATGQKGVINGELHVIPATPFQVTISPPSSGTFGQDLGVVNHATGVPFQKVTTTPNAGQYSVSGAVYTFASADNVSAISVDIYYDYTVTTGKNIVITNQLMGYTPFFKAVLTNQFEGDELVLTLNKCISTKLTIPTKLEDYMITELDFSAMADSSNTIGRLDCYTD
jgi:hypothetical protein